MFFSTANWPKEIEALLPKQRPFLDCVIDSAGGPIVAQVGKLMKEGGIIVCYGQYEYHFHPSSSKYGIKKII